MGWHARTSTMRLTAAAPGGVEGGMATLRVSWMYLYLGWGVGGFGLRYGGWRANLSSQRERQQNTVTQSGAHSTRRIMPPTSPSCC